MSCTFLVLIAQIGGDILPNTCLCDGFAFICVSLGNKKGEPAYFCIF